MIATELISTDIFPLKKTDTCESATVFMQDWRVFQLPVVDNGKLIGYVSFDKLADAAAKEKIEKHIEPLTQLFVTKSNHLFEVIRLFAETQYTCLAVCDVEFNYEGAISLTGVAKAYKSSSLVQPGAIVSLVMNQQDYSLSELARIIEYNDCKILHVFISSDSETLGNITVSLKLNKQNITTVIQTLERYQYRIQSIHQADEQNADLHSRYDWLIKYLI